MSYTDGLNLDKEYVKDGMTVKLYSPDMSELGRIAADIQIKEKVINIVSELVCEEIAG